jgi:hypothetical protein
LIRLKYVERYLAPAPKILQAMKDNPPSQKSGSFNLGAIEGKLKAELGN